MENLISRHRNVTILVAVLFAQVLGLAVQVKRSGHSEQGTRLIRLWTVGAVTPFEKALVWLQQSFSGTWHNYVYLRGVRAENRDLKQQIEQMRIEQVRLAQDAEQARRLQLLLGFKETFIAKTIAAQVIGSSGSEQSRSVYIDKGSADGVKTDQAVLTADGVVGKVIDVYQDHTAKVLLVNDQSSGVGVVLEKSRLQGILRGTPAGELVVEKILSDESVQPGERVLTSGGDQIFPKGLNVGVVRDAVPGKDSFLNINLKPGANLNRLEEVLVVTAVQTRTPTLAEAGGHLRAADILAERLPSVPPKPAADPTKAGSTPISGGANKVSQNTSPVGASTAGKPVVPKNVTSPGTSNSAFTASDKAAGGPKNAAVATGARALSGENAAKPVNGTRANAAAPGTKSASSTVVPTSTNNAKPSLVTKPESERESTIPKSEPKSAVPAQAPAAPPEDPQ